MNAFMVLVERAVRPVQAGPKKKLRMREELLAHLTAIHEEELARLGDDAAARAEAIRRFGDPAALTVELEQSVTWNDRIDARLNRAFGWRPGESATRYSARLAGFMALAILPWLPFVLVASGMRRTHDGTVPTTALLLRFFSGVLVFVPATVFVIAMLYVRLRDSLHGAFGTPRSWRRVVGYAVLSLVVLPLVGTAFSLVSLGDARVMMGELSTPSSIVVMALGYLFVPLYLVWFARKVGPNEIRHVEWSSLDLGQ